MTTTSPAFTLPPRMPSLDSSCEEKTFAGPLKTNMRFVDARGLDDAALARDIAEKHRQPAVPDVAMRDVAYASADAVQVQFRVHGRLRSHDEVAALRRRARSCNCQSPPRKRPCPRCRSPRWPWPASLRPRGRTDVSSSPARASSPMIAMMPPARLTSSTW